MKITVIGGSQGTGRNVAEQARDAGNDVTVVSRSGKVPDGVRSVVGDATDPKVAEEAIAGADAVVITVGGSKGSPRHRTDVTKAAIEAMRRAGVRRLVVQSSLGAGDSGQQLPQPFRLFAKVALAKPIADHNAQEDVVRASGLDWTIVRPPGLTDQPATGEWLALEVGDGGTLNGRISRADLAAFILASLDSDAAGREVGVSSR